MTRRRETARREFVSGVDHLALVMADMERTAVMLEGNDVARTYTASGLYNSYIHLNKL